MPDEPPDESPPSLPIEASIPVSHEMETLAGDLTEPDVAGGANAADPGVVPALGELFAERYCIERCIGRGSMGTVYAVHDRVIDDIVALKLLATPSEGALHRFRQEVRLARRVTHRNAARTFDLAEYGGAHFITMELIEGDSLSIHLARDGVLPPRKVMLIARQVCLGLQAAHDVDVVHRDLKPANVLLEPGGRAVITDFGVACSTSAGKDGSHTMPMAGTPAYMAPEQVMRVAVDGRADLYALGVMLFEMLTGNKPWTGGNQIEVAMARLHRPVPDPSEHVELPAPLTALVQRCMDRDPALRPPSAADVVALLDSLLEEPSATSDAATPSWASSPALTDSLGSSLGSVFAPTAIGEQALAVMPFRYQGPPGDAYMVEALTDELIDLLSMTRGLRVSARGATSRFPNERDAQTVGRALGVDAIIDGTVQRRGEQVRIVARLIEVATGFQKWSERFTGRLQDVFEMQDRMAKRVTEALRVELAMHQHGAVASAEAVEHYLRGRTRARPGDADRRALTEAIEHFDQALSLAPAFVLPVAARADAAVRAWFVSMRPGDEPRAQAAAREAVAAALEHADSLAETHLAAARLEVNQGDFFAAATQLNQALTIAPTYAAAHEYLGMLQCDAGRSKEGAKHIRLAHELDPTLGIGTLAVLRHYALRGDAEHYESMLEQVRRSTSTPRFGLDLFDFRVALWRGDLDRARGIRWPPITAGPIKAVVSALEAALDPDVDDQSLGQLLERAAEGSGSPRLRTAWRQISVEVLAWRGAIDLALAVLAVADSESVLLDADWLESCPVLTPLRTRPEFVAIRERVRARANQIWRVERRAI